MKTDEEPADGEDASQVNSQAASQARSWTRLDEPTKCCGAGLLIWIASLRRFECPCGKTQIEKNEFDGSRED